MRRSSTAALSLLLVVSLATPSLAAQGPARLGLADRTTHAINTPRQPYRDSLPQTEWKTGMLAGGLAGAGIGLLAAAAHHNFCDRADCGSDFQFFVIPTMVFALIGGLIGSGIHKQE
ncbi:MAG TPA: hypothetical protein VGM20_12880 [Gemmatimonadales bacterium]